MKKRYNKVKIMKGENKMEIKLRKTIGFFLLYWILLAVGVYVGQFVPLPVAVSISLFTIVALLTVLILRLNLPPKIFPFVAFGLGIVLYQALNYFVTEEGIGYVISVIFMALVMFLTAGVLGLFVFKNTENWITYLLVALISLIAVQLVTLFLPIEGMEKWLSMVGLLLFLAFTIYDFNRIKRNDYEPMEMGFSLFINLLNIIVDLLRLVREITK